MPVLNIQSFSCRLSDVDGKSPMAFESGFSLKQGGDVKIHGKVDPAAPSVEADLNLKAVSLTPLQPYLNPVAAVTLKSAELSLQGNFQYGIMAAGANIAYTGSRQSGQAAGHRDQRSKTPDRLRQLEYSAAQAYPSARQAGH